MVGVLRWMCMCVGGRVDLNRDQYGTRSSTGQIKKLKDALAALRLELAEERDQRLAAEDQLRATVLSNRGDPAPRNPETHIPHYLTDHV